MKLRPTRFAAMLIALACFVFLQGCTDPKAAVVGTYEIDKAAIKAAAEAEMKKEGKSDPGNVGAAMMAGMIDQMGMTMNLNADGTVTVVTSGMGPSKTASGTWTISGSTISITAAEPGEKPESITGTISGDTISLKPPEGEKMPFDLMFKKKKS